MADQEMITLHRILWPSFESDDQTKRGGCKLIDNLILSTDIIITMITLVEFHGRCFRRHVARPKR